MNKRYASLALLTALVIISAFILFRHLTTPKKPSGGWYHGGPYTLTIQKAGGMAYTVWEWTQISTQPPQTNFRAPSLVQVYVSGKSADKIASLLDQYDIEQWSHEEERSAGGI